MAHFAQLNENNQVTQVIVVNNDILVDSNGQELEQLGIDFCHSTFGQDTEWVQTSYNANFRKHYASIGDTYDSSRDAFIAPQPYPSWNLNETTCVWQPPIPYPADGKMYTWNEAELNWLNIV